MKRIAVGIAAIVALMGTPALAADMALKAPPAPLAAPQSWTGFYLGVNAGGGWTSGSSAAFSDIPTQLTQVTGIPNPISFNAAGAVGGLQIGYNLQFDRSWLVGAEADFDFSGINGNGASGNIGFGGVPLTATASDKLDWFGTLRGRFGFLPTSNLLIYGTGGLAYGRVSQSAQDSNVGTGNLGALDGSCSAGAVCYAGTSARIAVGWTAGAGIEYALFNNWRLKAEYLYINLGSNTFNEGVLVPGPLGASSLTAQFNTVVQVARAGVNYKF